MRLQHRVNDATVDYWLQQSLRERYSAALREPLPDVLTKLLGPDTCGNEGRVVPRTAR